MPQIPRTGTDIEFPDGAVMVLNSRGELTGVKDKDGVLLWPPPLPETPLPLPETAAHPDAHLHRGHTFRVHPRTGNLLCYTCIGRLSKGTHGNYAPKKWEKEQAKSPDVHDYVADLLNSMESLPPSVPTSLPDTVSVPHQLPRPVIQGLTVALGNAQIQASLSTDPRYFEGWVGGAHTVLGLVCGALGYDLGFLIEQEKREGGE